jgi:DDE superfamily endonuclease/Helix-turn-helix of DDE superfamily endonuclease
LGIPIYNIAILNMNYFKIRENEKQFRALTTLNIAEFDELLVQFDSDWDVHIRRYTLKGKIRTSRYSAKQDEVLGTIEEKLFFILLHAKTNTLQEMLAASFNMTQGMVNIWIHALYPILEKSLEKYHAARTSEALNDKLVEGHTYIADATDREIQRPTKDQEAFFSGKQKCHTIKNMTIISLTSFILFLSVTVTGKKHDKRLADECVQLKKNIELRLDSAYVGYKPEGVSIIIPHKASKNKPLTRRQKKENQFFARDRVLVEHTYASVKRLRILKEINRHHKTGFRDRIMNIGVALHNFRVTKRYVTLL